MSAAAAPNPATRHWVTCETSDQQQIAVKMEVLRLSHTFDDMCKHLGLEEGPGTFPVQNIEARVFYDVVDWCKKHKGKPDPVVEKDPFTQESKRFKLTKYEQWFLDLPVPELLKLVLAASYLDIRGLYQYGCQAIADLIKGKETLEARHILQQQFDLTRSEVRCTRAQCPWLDTKADVLGEPGDVANPIHIPPEVLTTIFEKLTRVDLERLQLVSQQFRNIIQHNEELPLRPLHEVHFTTSANYWTERHGILVLGVGEAKRLKCCAVRKLVFRDPITSTHCARLLGAKSAWKHAVVSVSLDRFVSPETLSRALTDLLFCRKLRFSGQPPCSPHSFLHLPVVISCNYLNIREK
ncbi:SKR-1 protein, partial [Aphelenchoides avenae]